VTPFRKMFVNLPVQDLKRSVEFFTQLGFTFNAKFTDENATCMIVGEDAFVMLLVERFFKTFTQRQLCDTRTHTEGLVAISVDSRAEVDRLVKTAVAAGGSHAVDPQDHGFMYGWSFYDPDGHHWEVFWMDPDAAGVKETMNPVVHFEMPYEDRERMARFYRSAFGWQTQMLGQDMGDYVVVTATETDETGPRRAGRINGGFYPKRPEWPAQYPSVVIAVDEIATAMRKVAKAGGRVLGEPMEIPGVGQYVSFYDTEGNRVSMLQPIPRNWHASNEARS